MEKDIVKSKLKSNNFLMVLNISENLKTDIKNLSSD